MSEINIANCSFCLHDYVHEKFNVCSTCNKVMCENCSHFDRFYHCRSCWNIPNVVAVEGSYIDKIMNIMIFST